MKCLIINSHYGIINLNRIRRTFYLTRENRDNLIEIKILQQQFDSCFKILREIKLIFLITVQCRLQIMAEQFQIEMNGSATLN